MQNSQRTLIAQSDAYKIEYSIEENADEVIFYKTFHRELSATDLADREIRVLKTPLSPFFLPLSRVCRNDHNICIEIKGQNGLPLLDFLAALDKRKEYLSVEQCTYLYVSLLDSIDELREKSSACSGQSFLLFGSLLKNLWLGNDGELHTIGIVNLSDHEIEERAGKWGVSAAPEVLLGGKSVDFKAEMFVFGMLMFRIATLRQIVSDVNQSPLLMVRLGRNLHPQISDVRGGMLEFEPVLAKCLQFDPENRYKSHQEIKEDLLSITQYDNDSAKQSLAKLMSSMNQEQTR